MTARLKSGGKPVASSISTASATLAVSQFLRNSQFPFGTYRHQGQRFNPAWDYAVNREFSWFATCDRAVKHGTVDQLTGVVHANAVSTCRNSTFTLGQNTELQTRFSAVHTVFLTVFFQIFDAISRHSLETLATNCISTFVDFTQCAMHNINRHCRVLTFQRVSDTRYQRFRQQSFQSGFAQLLSYLQTNAVACLRFDSVKSRVSHHISFHRM